MKAAAAEASEPAAPAEATESAPEGVRGSEAEAKEDRQPGRNQDGIGFRRMGHDAGYPQRRVAAGTGANWICLAPDGRSGVNTEPAIRGAKFHSEKVALNWGSDGCVLYVITSLQGVSCGPVSIQICQSISFPTKARDSHVRPLTCVVPRSRPNWAVPWTAS